MKKTLRTAGRYRLPAKEGDSRARHRPKTKPRGVLLRLFMGFMAFSMVLALCGTALVTHRYRTTSIKAPNAEAVARTSVVYYDDGVTEIGRIATFNRIPVSSERIPQHVKDAIIAAEDRSFYENRGVSPVGIARAFWRNAMSLGGRKQGGSTITQQYVKVFYLKQDRTISRKINEAIYALKIDGELTKDEILTNYLNTIYFGRRANGIQAAAQAYFKTDVDKLTVEQAAVIAGLVPSPNGWDPAKGPKSLAKNKQRWKYVLDGMVTMGTLDAAQRAAMQYPDVPAFDPPETYKGANGYMMKAVENELIAKFKEDGINKPEAYLGNAGLRIVTTFNPKMQEQIYETFTDPKVFPTKGRPAGMRGGGITIDPKNGEVKAMFAGVDYMKRKRNQATQDNVQAGSTFKAFTLAAALEKGISLNSQFDGRSGLVVGKKNVKNSSSMKEFSENPGAAAVPPNLRKAAAHSVNTVFIQLNQKVGPRRMMEAAWKAGIPKSADGSDGFAEEVGNTLGSASATALSLTSAYSTFAAQGVKHTPHFVREAKDPTGRVVYAGPAEGERVFAKDVSADLSSALQGSPSYGTASVISRLIPGRQVAGKTGTSTDSKSANFIGFTPQLATGIVFYNEGPNGEQLSLPGNKKSGNRYTSWRKSGSTHSGFAALVWARYMAKVLDGMPKEKFPKAAGVGKWDGTMSEYPQPEPDPNATETTDPEPTVTETIGPDGKPTPIGNEPTTEPTDDLVTGRPVEPKDPKDPKKPGDGTNPKDPKDPKKPGDGTKPKDPKDPRPGIPKIPGDKDNPRIPVNPGGNQVDPDGTQQGGQMVAPAEPEVIGVGAGQADDAGDQE